MPTALKERVRPTVLLVGIVLGAGLAAVVAGVRDRTPGDRSIEAGFARDMATHHAQAVEMAFLVRDASTDPDLRTLAYDIIATQSAQRGVFMGWLQQWGLPQASTRPRMAWMPGHGGDAGVGAPTPMHGMATAHELSRLRAATGVEAETLFLQLMIRHHEGGVLMARAAVAQSPRDEVAAMARSIDDSQRAEISLMRDMLARRGATPLPSLLD